MTSQKRPTRNKYVRFTSNVLRSGGIINDAFCFLVAYLLTVIVYRAWYGYYYDVRLHSTAVIVMAINFFLIRISRDAYSAFRGQGDDLGSGTFLDFLVALTLTGFTILQFGVIDDLPRRFAFIFIGICFGLLIFTRLAFRRIVWLSMRRGIIGQRVAIYGADREVTSRLLELLEIERLPHINIIGFADDRKTRVETGMIGRFPYLGGFEELLELARRGMLDQLIVALPLVTYAFMSVGDVVIGYPEATRLISPFAMGIGLVVYFLCPAAPPWLTADKAPQQDIYRVMANVGRTLNSSLYDRTYSVLGDPNAVAAMPSLHQAITFMLFLFALHYGRKLATIALVYSLMMGFALVYTGEHYVIDALVGCAIATYAYLFTGRWLNHTWARCRCSLAIGPGMSGSPPSACSSFHRRSAISRLCWASATILAASRRRTQSPSIVCWHTIIIHMSLYVRVMGLPCESLIS